MSLGSPFQNDENLNIMNESGVAGAKVAMVNIKQKIYRAHKGRYIFVPKVTKELGTISLALIDERDVPAMRQIRHGCCGKPKVNILREATAEEVAAWENV